MKRLACTGLAVIVSAGMLTGCGSDSKGLEADRGTVYVSKDGTVTSLDVEVLNEDYYDETELKEYVDSQVKSYNTELGSDAVAVESFTVENGTAKLELSYKTVQDYSAFNDSPFKQVELYQGNVAQAMADGYDFNVDFVQVEDGTIVNADRDDIVAQGDLKVVIIKADTDVKVDGTIVYVSSENVTLTGSDTVSIQEGTSAATDSVDETATEEILTEEDTESMVVAGELVFETEQPEEQEPDKITSLYENPVGTEVYTYIIYK